MRLIGSQYGRHPAADVEKDYRTFHLLIVPDNACDKARKNRSRTAGQTRLQRCRRRSQLREPAPTLGTA